jgi:tetratricopeptide (TPR) repeat protein
MIDPDQHDQLIESGLALHEARDYAAALCVFQQALRETPECVSAQYNVANTLNMLERHGEAASVLTNLLATSDEIFLSGCPLGEDPTSFKLDALYLMFLATLYATESWDDAFPYAINHLEARSGGVESVFSDECVEKEIESLRSQYQS